MFCTCRHSSQQTGRISMIDMKLYHLNLVLLPFVSPLIVCCVFDFAARKRRSVVTGKRIIIHINWHFSQTSADHWLNALLLAVDPLPGRLPHLYNHRCCVCGPHAHYSHVLLCVSMLWELWRGDASETEEKRRLSQRFLHGLACGHHHFHHVSHPPPLSCACYLY